MICEGCGVELHGFTRPWCLRCKGMVFGRVPGGSREGNDVAPRTADPAWERGIAGEYRPGGGFVPYLTLDGGGHEMSVKELADNRAHIEKVRDQQRHDPNFYAHLKGN